MLRRNFIASISAAAASAISAWAAKAPWKFAHREGNMLRQSSPAVYELAASIPGRSIVKNADTIKRAHPRFVENLNALGADVEWK